MYERANPHLLLNFPHPHPSQTDTLKTTDTAPTELARYIYDASGRRVRSFVNGVEKWFVYGIGGELMAEYTPTANQTSPSKEYGYRGGEILIATETSPSFTIRWMLYDLLGSARIITDLSGGLATIERHDYLPYGEEIAPTVGQRNQGWQGYGVNTQRKKFTGYERDDESGLDFAQARYYASVQGRFTSPDPLLSSGTVTDPQSWNRYTYVGNRPTIATDPDGLLWYGYTDAAGWTTYVWFNSDAEFEEKKGRYKNAVSWRKITYNITYIGDDGHLVTLYTSGNHKDWGKIKRIDYQAGIADDAHREASRMVDGVTGDFVIITLENAIPLGRAAKGGILVKEIILDLVKDEIKEYVINRVGEALREKGWLPPEGWAQHDADKIRDLLREEVKSQQFPSGEHKFADEMNKQLLELAKQADANGVLGKYGEKLREIAETYAKRKSTHRGGRTGRGQKR